jgi:nitroimidazol reductase NimA-like FMN-containing flavoprotein (pyridoxamine 5'-phosphate oxidase superfamily)
MRRKDREVSSDEALAIVDKALYAVLSTVSGDGSPYGVPISIVREGEWIYFHGALEGHKVDNIKLSNKVSLCCVGEAAEPADDFTVFYESAIVFGTAEALTGEREKHDALKLLCQRHMPEHMAAFESYTAQRLGRTGVWRIHVDAITGKAHRR